MPIPKFVGHILVGTSLFLFFGVVSITISSFIQFLEAFMFIPRFTLEVLVIVERVILIADAALYLAYLGITGWRVLKEMLK